MKYRLLIFSLVIWWWWAGVGLALDWKPLHERADLIGLAEAEAEVAKAPDSPDKLYLLGLVYINLRQDDKAEQVFEKMLKLDDKSVEASWGKAEVLRRRHELGKSALILEDLIKKRPDYPPSYISLAFLRFVQLDFNQSARLVSEVIRMGRKKVDLTNYVLAIALYGGSKGMIANRGGPLSKLINGTAVLSNLKKAQKLQPDSLAALFGLGGYYLLAPSLAGGDVNLAIEYLEKAVKVDPRFADVYVRLAQAYKVKKDNRKYQFYLKTAMEIDPGNEFALDVKSGKCSFICPGESE